MSRGKLGFQFRITRRCAMKRLRLWVLVMAGLSLTATGSSQGDDERRLRADLTGLEEVPVVNTVASGKFRARISRDEQSIEYRLSYSGLQGTVSQAHIHIAQPSVNGSIVIWLCQTATNPGPAPHICVPRGRRLHRDDHRRGRYSRGHGEPATHCE